MEERCRAADPWPASTPEASVAGPGDGTGVKVWDARSGALVRDLPVSGGAYAGFSPDGRWLVTGTSSEYRSWEPGSWQPAHRIPTHFEGTLPGNVAFSFDGTLMAIRYSSTMLHLIDPATSNVFLMLTPCRLAHTEGYNKGPGHGLITMPLIPTAGLPKLEPEFDCVRAR